MEAREFFFTIRNVAVVIIILMVVSVLCLLAYATIGYNLNFEPGVIIDRTIHPSTHQWSNAIVIPSTGENEMYCLHAETVNRGERAELAYYYRYFTGRTYDRFGYEDHYEMYSFPQFTLDDSAVLDTTMVIPKDAIDIVILTNTLSYGDPCTVHVVVKRCDSGETP